MKLVLDTCVLFPTVMREMLIGAARQGAFQPLWSPRIIEEWRRAAIKHGPEAALRAEADAALLKAAFPKAELRYDPAQEARFWLPDPSDIHVLAAAALGCAEGIVTLNNADFPQNVLAEEGLTRINPDALLLGIWQSDPAMIERLCTEVLQKANAVSGAQYTLRSLLKKARLPRLGKAVSP